MGTRPACSCAHCGRLLTEHYYSTHYQEGRVECVTLANVRAWRAAFLAAALVLLGLIGARTCHGEDRPAPKASWPAPLSVFLVAPCRFVDTRDELTLPIGSPLGPVTSFRFYQVQGACGVPLGAKAVFVNVTATQATTDGHLSLFNAALTAIPNVSLVPKTSTLNFSPGRTVANLAIVELGPVVYGDEADLGIYVCAPGGAVDVVLDVVAYLQ